MRLLARLFGDLVVEIAADGTLSTYYRLNEIDYPVTYLINDLNTYKM